MVLKYYDLPLRRHNIILYLFLKISVTLYFIFTIIY